MSGSIHNIWCKIFYIDRGISCANRSTPAMLSIRKYKRINSVFIKAHKIVKIYITVGITIHRINLPWTVHYYSLLRFYVLFHHFFELRHYLSKRRQKGLIFQVMTTLILRFRISQFYTRWMYLI